MKELIYIHGGTLAKDINELCTYIEKREINPFEEKKRRRMTLQQELPEYTVIRPEMPLADMASYKVWKLYFEKHIPFLTGEKIVLIGHSLGGMFLLKYLGENDVSFRIDQLHIVSPVLDEKGLNDGDNYIGDFKYNPECLKTIRSKAKKIWLWHSKDDPTVPFNHSERINTYLNPDEFKIFEDRGHFNQPEFPEIIEIIKAN